MGKAVLVLLVISFFVEFSSAADIPMALDRAQCRLQIRSSSLVITAGRPDSGFLLLKSKTMTAAHWQALRNGEVVRMRIGGEDSGSVYYFGTDLREWTVRKDINDRLPPESPILGRCETELRKLDDRKFSVTGNCHLYEKGGNLTSTSRQGFLLNEGPNSLECPLPPQ